MSELPRKVLIPLAALAALAAAACNTVAGAGEDLENAGAAVSDTAQDVQQDMQEPAPTTTPPPAQDPYATPEEKDPPTR